MDNFSANWEQKSLINELAQGLELAKQLQIHLNVSSSSHETRELLVHKILNSYDKALSILKFKASAAEPQPELSLRSLAGSSNSEDSDFDFKDHEHVNASRKRKSVPRWTKQAQVCPGLGLEGPLDDGFSWRKYGQKDIPWSQISEFKAENSVPSHTMTGNNLMTTTNFSPSFMSPGTSGSNYFTVSPTNMISFDRNQALPAPESELGGIVLASTASTTNSPTLGLDFPFGGLDDHFEPTFSFDNSRFF
ncbi:WRKY family transcription factor [Actinidia rufa]|uniref:WRKY family transcription factor n=1 Tax=Actinidia rufa TaxID=165716 RepID=A0A7J0DCS0_9ERIC|nr:WRKY family transcription factor [Actinidia rufa]